MLSYVYQEKKGSFLVIWDLLARQILCLAELSMKKFYNLRARYKSRNVRKRTFGHVRPVKIQIN